MYQQLPYNISLIDTGLIAPEIAACYLLESHGETAIIETGSFRTTERVLSLLEKYGLDKEKVRYVIPTHVHLDHAGGASSLLEALPNAQLVIHPRGARHMIDPTKLIAGAKVVYGEEKFKAMYGEIHPIDEHRVLIAEDNSSLTFGDRKLVFRDTPGHASHHFCVWDEMSRGWFTGDTFGISYPKLTNAAGRFIFPTTTPVQFDPDLLVKSIEMLMSYQPKYMYLTHFGSINVTTDISDNLCRQITDYVAMVESLSSEELNVENIKSLMLAYSYEKFTEHDSQSYTQLSIDEFEKITAMDIQLNSQGLLVWQSRQQSVS